MKIQNSVFGKLLAGLMVVSFLAPVNLALAAEVVSKAKDVSATTKETAPEKTKTETESTPPVFSISPDSEDLSEQQSAKDDKPVSPAEEEKTQDKKEPPDQQLGTEDQVQENTRSPKQSKIKAEPAPLTGAFYFEYPIVIPTGRNGLEPDLKLIYSSDNKDNLGVYGYGWSDSIPYIERINYYGVEELYAPYNQHFFSSIDGELVYIQTNGNFDEYRDLDDDGNYRKYEFSPPSGSTGQWTVTDKFGTVYKFGYTESARLDNAPTSTNTFRWMLEEVRDRNDNYIKYEYFKDEGQIYPSKIIYTGNGANDGSFEIEFVRELRPDPTDSFRTAFPVKNNYHIKEIVAKVQENWVRKYTLNYASGDNTRRQVLSSITESGQDESSNTISLPDTTFETHIALKGWEDYPSNNFPGGWVNDNGEDMGARLSDINGDGYADVIISRYRFDTGNYVDTFLNDTKGGWTGNHSNWFSPTIFVHHSGSSNLDQGVRLVDVNGDGLVDILQGKSGVSRTWLNNGNGWTESGNWNPPAFVNNSGSDIGWRFGDIDGDGLTDMMLARVNNNVWESYVWVNTPQGWVSVPWSLPENITFIDNYWHDTGVRIVDINGDGLVDILNTETSYVNDGNKGWITSSIWASPVSFVYGGGGENNGLPRGARLSDINGDGLPDILYTNDPNGWNEERTAYINTGNGWIEDPAWAFPFYFVDNYWRDMGVRSGDLNGDGMEDFQAPALQKNRNTGNRSDQISKVTLSSGGNIDVSYQSSANYTNSSGSLSPNLPFTLDTVRKISSDDGLGNIHETQYTYSGGDYYFLNPKDRKFAGFGQISKFIDGFGTTTDYFHQGNGPIGTRSELGEYDDNFHKIGKIYRTEVKDINNAINSVEIGKWNFRPNGSGYWNIIYRDDFLKSDYDGNSTHKDRATTDTFDFVTGNIIQQIEWGEVLGNNDGTFTDTSVDKFVTDLSYASNSSFNIYGLPSVETTSDQNANLVRERKYYYDNLPLGQVDKGNPTKEEHWKSGSSYIDIERTFNSYGLVTEEKDPRDKTTTYSYDFLNLYPTVVTNPLGHQTQYIYDYSLGKPKEVTDPNGYRFQTVYDALDRVKEEKQPQISNPSNLVIKTLYSYFDDGLPRRIQKTNYLDSATSTDFHTYLDGLERVIQTRTETESPNTFSVKDISYNSLGKKEKESLPYFGYGVGNTAPTSNPFLYVNYNYDSLGRVATVTNDLGVTTNTYNDWKVTVTDPLGKIKRFYKDAYENLIKVEEENGAEIYVTAYEWNGNKNLTKITDAEGNIRDFTYDGLGRRLTAEDLHNPSDSTFGTWTYGYDDSGNLTSQTDPKNQTVDFTYDDLNRILTEDYTGETGIEIEYGYDSCSGGIGRLCTANSTDVIYKPTYNSLGLPDSETKTIDSLDHITLYSYNRQGNPTSIRYPDNYEILNVFNTSGLLESIKQKEKDGSWTDVVTDINYSPTGQIAFRAFQNGVNTTYTYDSSQLYRLANIKTVAPQNNQPLMIDKPEISDFVIEEVDDNSGFVPIPQRFGDGRLLNYEELSDGKIKYSYKTDRKVDNLAISRQVLKQAQNRNLVVLGERKEQRTKNSRIFATNKENIFLAEVVSGAPQYYEDKTGEWWFVNYATTTKDYFVSQLNQLNQTDQTQDNQENQKDNQKESRKISQRLKKIILSLSRVFAKRVLAQQSGTFHPDPNPEVNTVDGYVRHRTGGINEGTGIPWQSLRHSFGTESGDSGYEDGYILIEADILQNKWRIIDRVIRLFDTSSIPDNATILSATYSESTQAKGYDQFNCEINIYSSNPASNTALVAGDFDSLGGNEITGEPFASPITMASMPATEGTYTDWQLNTSGLAHISKTGITKFGVRESKYDGANIEPIWANSNFCQFIFNNSEEDGTSKDPKLVVVYEVPTSGLINPGGNDSEGQVIQDISYTYDVVGNITEIRDQSETAVAKDILFEYDDLYRLTRAYTTSATSTPFSETYTYNSLGNILSKSDVGNYLYEEINLANPHAVTLIGGTSLSYDNNGNLTSFGSNSYEWDWYNRMTSTTNGGETTNYSYDHTGERVKMIADGEETLFVNKYWDKVTDGAGNATTTKHIYDNSGGLVATVEGGSLATSTYYIHTDHLGGTNVVTDSSGSIVEVTDYLPFGKINTSEQTSSFTEKRKFTGHIYDESSDLNYMNARYQDGEIGRFLSQDPAFQVVGTGELKQKTGLELEGYLSDPQLHNSYSYVRNNPVKYQDPTGEAAVLATLIALFTPNVAYAPTSENFENPGLETAIFIGSLAVPGGASGKGTNKAVTVAVNKVDDFAKGGEKLLYRAMKEGADGMPVVENSARGLGVRVEGKIQDIAVDVKGMVRPGTGGMSVVPNSPRNLHRSFRPPEFGGTGKNPVWCITCSSLPNGLRYAKDSATHGTIQPAYSMPFKEYTNLLQSTKPFWKKVVK